MADGTDGLMSKSLHASSRDSLYVGLTRFPLSGQGCDRAHFIVDGMVESAEGMLGPGGFCYVPAGQSTSARAMNAAILLVIEWLPASATAQSAAMAV